MKDIIKSWKGKFCTWFRTAADDPSEDNYF